MDNERKKEPDTKDKVRSLRPAKVTIGKREKLLRDPELSDEEA